MTRTGRWLGLLGLPLALAACQNEHDIYERTNTDLWFQAQTDQVDILFVVDDSHSMAEEQEALSAGFSSFITELEATATDFHIGVITTSFDYADPDRGKLVGSPPVITRADNYEKLFTRRVVVGTTGSDREKGLEAAAYALSPVMRAGANAGLVRDEAFLLVVFVSDEDDCSDRGALESEGPAACYAMTDQLVEVEDLVAELQATKSEASQLYLGSIVGPKKSDGGCESAVPGHRYIGAAHATGGLVGNVCDADWSDILYELGLNATGVLTSFKLSDPAKPDTIEVSVDEEMVVQDPAQGWSYDEETWYVSFHGDSVPPRGSQIAISYAVASGG